MCGIPRPILGDEFNDFAMSSWSWLATQR